jgi:putative nucleotidyltransferase with HDIG domain
MPTNSPLLASIIHYDLLQPSPVVTLGHSFLSPSSDWDKLSQQQATVLLLRLLQRKCPSLYQHSLRVRHLTLIIAEHLLLSREETAFLVTAALLHDIGKMTLPDALLQKPGRLTKAEFEHVKQHSLSGARILSWMHMPDPITTLVYHHHERWDGSGYPDGLQGDAIPLGARIIALVDALDVMTDSNRPYQIPRTPLSALQEVQRCAGSQLDPTLVTHFSHLILQKMQEDHVVSSWKEDRLL